MSAEQHHRREAVGERFSLPAMMRARDLTFEAVRRIAAEIKPGVTEGRGDEIAHEVLKAMGMERLWHRNVIRFGPDTLKTFFGDFAPDYVLQPNDIFYVDLGAVWDGHEGDAGDTFVVGDDAEMHACAQAARDIWAETAAQWRDHGVTGEALYRFAKQVTEAKGWRLNWSVKGHRVSDFPHAIHKGGKLGEFDGVPVSGLWILEIQIAHPTRAIGAFYEDLLIEAADEKASAA